jgi:hypothetical protein
MQLAIQRYDEKKERKNAQVQEMNDVRCEQKSLFVTFPERQEE